MSHGTRILIVDDEPAIRRFLRSSLLAEGFVVEQAETAAAALLALRQAKPDLVILDLGLPDKDGLDVVREIRTQSAVPIIILSVRNDEAGKVAQLLGTPLNPFRALYLATRGGAEAMGLEDRVGSLAPGREADMVVLDPKATELLAFRSARTESLEELLAVLMTLGDDRAVKATYVAGRSAK